MKSAKQAIALVLAWFAVSCAPPSSAVTKECKTNPDQANLYKGHWTTHPIPLAVEVNDFSNAELAALEGAINTWNGFFSASKGFSLFLNNNSSLGFAASGARITSATACNQTVIGPGGFTNKVMIYKTRSGWSYGSSIIALTSLCPVVTSGSPFRSFLSAVMEINFQSYFVAGQPVPDLQSVVTHELGHMLGLDHSCNGAACSNAPSEYTNAVMYPALGFNGINGQMKRDLQGNDEERANCLY